MNNPFHFTLKDSKGQMAEQDRWSWFFEDFLAERLLDGDIWTPWEITSVSRTDKRNGETVTIDTPQGLKDVFRDTIDELESQRREIDGVITDLEVAIKDLG